MRAGCIRGLTKVKESVWELVRMSPDHCPLGVRCRASEASLDLAAWRAVSPAPGGASGRRSG